MEFDHESGMGENVIQELKKIAPALETIYSGQGSKSGTDLKCPERTDQPSFSSFQFAATSLQST
jgi:hypothetical protein